ncbi:MAG TPA: cytochrome c biogenesis protein CcsA [Longimicrobiales bacterium]
MASAVNKSRLLTGLGVLTLVSFVAIQISGFVLSPPDRGMGHLQKIMYVHVPAAWSAFIAFTIVFAGSALYLWRRDEKWDMLGAAAAEVGTFMTALTLLLGSIWGRPTWGVWWTWDPRLTTTAILLMIFAGYLALRSFTEDADRRATWSAAIGILGFVNVPIVYMSVRWWRTLHQVQSDTRSLDPLYLKFLALNGLVFMLATVWFIGRSYTAARLERAVEAKIENEAFEALLRTHASEARIRRIEEAVNVG